MPCRLLSLPIVPAAPPGEQIIQGFVRLKQRITCHLGDDAEPDLRARAPNPKVVVTQTTAMSFSTLVAPGADHAVLGSDLAVVGRLHGSGQDDLAAFSTHMDIVRIEIPRAMQRVRDLIAEAGGMDPRLDGRLVRYTDDTRKRKDVLKGLRPRSPQ